MTKIRTLSMLMTASFVLLAAIPLASADSECNFTNNGIIVSGGDVGNENCGNDTYDNDVSYLQYCDQGTGAGAGAAGVGVGPGAEGDGGGAAAGASTDCTQWAN